ncbi:nucleotidyltransferase domain-containing protein [Antrihabitans stalactiti]|uniref:Nucleotidyltransferase domain-containing protein n=1 Tax=Antrihabitans stalactiti TaxID=2584121 RepID=A0A848KIS8_9NOCA|nr:nucleotidyltransferase domain-containing protein [Antrihabitans stalactiti]NMN98051.1 nucleotidyltransferase domain-containing protein [Antrihabitans stalactiti]
MIGDERLRELAFRLTTVEGIVGVTLGGSRARGTHQPDSDVDIGLYYRPPLDTAALAGLAREVAGVDATVTARGEWGPWVDGGAWLTIEGGAVDWLYRDLDRVIAVWAGAKQGAYGFHAQNGHPFGFADFAYAGELALALVLADPTGELDGLRRTMRDYPEALSKSLVARLWEATFDVRIARKAIGRADTTFIAGCLFRAVTVCAHALHGHAGRWLINEKGAIAAASALPDAPADFAIRAHRLMGELGSTPTELADALAVAEELIAETRSVCEEP